MMAVAVMLMLVTSGWAAEGRKVDMNKPVKVFILLGQSNVGCSKSG